MVCPTFKHGEGPHLTYALKTWEGRGYTVTIGRRLHLNCITIELILLLFWFFLFRHILQFIYFKILFTKSKYLFLTEVMLVWLGHSWPARKSNRTFESIHVSKALGTLIIQQFCWALEVSLLNQTKQTATKSGAYFTNHDKFTGNCWFEESKTHVAYFGL